MKKILKAYRTYNLKNWRKIFLAAGLPIAVLIGALWILDVTLLKKAVWEWLFIALYVVFAAVIAKTLYTATKARPARLERHLYAINEKERKAIFEEFDEKNSENGRFFLSDFLLLFTDGGGIIRYAKIGDVSVIGRNIWLASGKKAVMLKAKTNAEALEVAKKIRSMIPDDVVIEEEEEPDEEQIRAQENDERILKEIVGVDLSEDNAESGEEDEDVSDNSSDDSGESEE